MIRDLIGELFDVFCPIWSAQRLAAKQREADEMAKQVEASKQPTITLAGRVADSSPPKYSDPQY